MRVNITLCLSSVNTAVRYGHSRFKKRDNLPVCSLSIQMKVKDRFSNVSQRANPNEKRMVGLHFFLRSQQTFIISGRPIRWYFSETDTISVRLSSRVVK